MIRETEIVDKIIEDIRERYALRHTWDDIDDRVKEEIKEAWAKIIREGG
jgi:hypothetical protein